MAKKAKPGDAGNGVTNLTELKEIMLDVNRRVTMLESDIGEATKEIGEEMKRVKRAGGNVKAFKLARTMSKMEGDDRKAFDEMLVIARENLGISIQTSMFDLMEPAKDEPEPDGDSDFDEKLAAKAPLARGRKALADAKAKLGTDTTADALH